ncbi:DUF3836 domain-containing protein [Parabacteroides sp. OttesenSCG-928-N08]|nr:DUF3836 domain-containing protein [Parabacteroides sp. OttesenSCG-928-N08]
MKTSVKRIGMVVVMAFAMVCSTVYGQEFFSQKEWKEGRLTSKTVYKHQQDGLYKKTFLIEYDYDGAGNLLLEDYFQWDSNSNQWLPDHQIRRETDTESGIISVVYYAWNAKKRSFYPIADKISYRMDNTVDRLSYLARESEEQVEVLINQPQRSNDNLVNR